jgi:tetratricopeptide (TPR) repeat protein
LLFGAVILLVPVAQAWRERQPIGALLAAATGPIILIGFGLMLYNALRFGSPFEFGVRYQLGGQRQVTQQFFSLHYLWFNFRVYFLEPARWSARSPFVHGIAVPPLPTGHNGVVDAFGILTNIPLVWLALAVPLAWRNRPGQAGSALRWFVTAAALLFGICALTLGLFCGANLRYEVDFLPALLLLAVVGILGLERVLAPTLESGLADRPVWRRVARWGWGLLLGFSVAFNVFVSVKNYAYADCALAGVLASEGRVPEAIQLYEKALRIKPDMTEAHDKLGVNLVQVGRVEEGIGHFEQALRIKPDYAEAHYCLGVSLVKLSKLQEAVSHYEQALRIKPDYAEAHNSWGVVLGRLGKLEDSIGHYEQALRSQPDYADAHYNLGGTLIQLGRVEDGIGHYEQALRIKPDDAEAHYDLGIALVRLGRLQEAIAQYEQALKIKPDFAEAQNELTRLRGVK